MNNTAIIGKRTWMLLGILNFVLILLSLFFRGESFDGYFVTHSDTFWSHIVFQLRLMSVLTSIAVGICLSIVGLYLQTLFANPLASPFTLGISPMSSLFVSLFIFMGARFALMDIFDSEGVYYGVQIVFSLIGAVCTFLLMHRLQPRFSNRALMILVGVLLGSFAGACQQLIEIFMNREQLQMNYFWNMGSFDISSFHIVCLLLVTAFLSYIAFLKIAKISDLFLFGDIYVKSMGVGIYNYYFLVIAVASLTIAIVVTFCGPIGFVGLVAPHIARSIVKTNRHHLLLPITALLGMSLSLVSLWISHWAIFETTIPINIVLSIIGVPYTFYIIFKQQR